MLAAFVSLLLAAASPAVQSDSLGAGWSTSTAEARNGVRERRFVPLSQVAAAIARRIPGRMLDAGLEAGDNGRQVYRVRWAAADGRRIDVIADAATGAIQREEGR